MTHKQNDKQGLILGIGNPLLDILATCDYDFVKRHNLQSGQTITNSDKYDALINELARQYRVKFIAGGSAQNTIRVIQWLLHSEPRICTFIGCIGKDFFGQCMRSRVEDEGVNVNYIEVGDKIKTGYCCVLAFKDKDSTQQSTMIAWLGAAHCFKIEHLNQYWNQVTRARIIILEGYFLEVCPQAIRAIAKHMQTCNDKHLCMNVAANYVISSFWNDFKQLLETIDYLFILPAELETIAKQAGWSTGSEESMLQQLADLPMANAKKVRHIILSGPQQIWTACTRRAVKTYEIPPTNEEEAKDNNGCRDAFVAGYLSKLLTDAPEKVCIETAIYASQAILKQDGCTIPKHPPTIEKE